MDENPFSKEVGVELLVVASCLENRNHISRALATDYYFLIPLGLVVSASENRSLV